MREKFRNFLEIFGALALLIVISVAFSARSSSAQGFFGNFLKNLFPGPANTTTTPPVPAYQPVADYENAVIQAVKKASPAVVSITISKNVPILENCVTPFSNLPPEFQQFFGDLPLQSQCPSGQTQLQEVGGGSGFIVAADGLILTNKHVVSDTKASYTVFTNDGKKYDATVLARDPAQDLAVLRINAQNLPTVEFGDSSGVELGQSAIAIGNSLAEFRNTVSVGVISGLARTIDAQGPTGAAERLTGVFQTDAAINPGNSGGPLLNLRGQVIGINTAIAEQAQNIGFAIPINRAKHDVETVRATGEIQASFLGVRYILITPDLVQSQKLAIDHGALVKGNAQNSAVASGSPAARAGIKSGDVITAVNGAVVDADHDLAEILSGYNPGDKVTLTIFRGGKTVSLDVTLDKRPQ